MFGAKPSPASVATIEELIGEKPKDVSDEKPQPPRRIVGHFHDTGDDACYCGAPLGQPGHANVTEICIVCFNVREKLRRLRSALKK